MRLPLVAGTVLACAVALASTGCDSASDSAAPPTTVAPEAPQTSTRETTESPSGETSSTTTTPGATQPSKTTPAETTPSKSTPAATTPSATTGVTTAAPRYALGPTRACLRRVGLRVGPVGDSDTRLQALGDLAQHTSVEVHRGDDVIGLAITDVKLLSELLAVPNDPYTIETHGNALLFFRPSARDTAERVRDCLRP